MQTENFRDSDITSKFGPKLNFLGQNDILSYKTIFGPTFSAILENLLETIFSQSPKNCNSGQKWPFLARLAKFGPNEDFCQKGLCYLFTLIVPQLHAKFRKNSWRGFRDQFVTNGRTDKGEIIEPVASLVQ